MAITNEIDFYRVLSGLDPDLADLLVYIRAERVTGDDALSGRLKPLEGHEDFFARAWALFEKLTPFILLGIGVLIGASK